MSTLYLLRHGQTAFNLEKRVQGRSDSPLTELGMAQAHAAAFWFVREGVHFDRLCTSPLGRARATLETVRADLLDAGVGDLPAIESIDGLMERSYGIFEAGPAADVPTELWDPGEALVPYGGEGSRALRQRIVATLTDLMSDTHVENLLAVSHGSATLQFKKAWEHLAACPQDVPLGNCCILVYTFDAVERTFTNTAIVNQEV